MCVCGCVGVGVGVGGMYVCGVGRWVVMYVWGVGLGGMHVCVGRWVVVCVFVCVCVCVGGIGG